MSHSRGILYSARFCPWCGVSNISRDEYKNRNRRVEFICGSCGVGFRLLESTRRQDANHLFTIERKVREPQEPESEFSRMARQKHREFKLHGKNVTRQLIREWIAINRPLAASQGAK